MREYDTFFLTELDEVKQDAVQDMILRELTPGRTKYRCQCVKARVSRDSAAYPDRLWPRLGRGQWVGEPWSVEVVETVDPIPEAWR